MLRLFIVLLVASVVGTAGAAESVGPSVIPSAAAKASSKNPAPLDPRGAAGIRLAQGASDRGVLIASGAILAAIVAALLLIEDDDETASTGTN